MELKTLDAKRDNAEGLKKLDDCLKNISPKLESESPEFISQNSARSALTAAENGDFKGL